MTANPKKLPSYSHLEEIYNSLSHLLGFLFGFAVLIVFIVFQISHSVTMATMIPFYIYIFFLMLMFFNSFLYHSRPLNSFERAVCRIIDHSDIHLFVAATYTPICIYGITNQSFSILILVLEWVLAVVGVIMNIIKTNNKIPTYVSFIIYLFAGWAIMIFYPFNIGMDFDVFLFILLGGITYTIGAIIYGVGSKLKWFHTIFHIFVLIAAIFQFIGIWFLMMKII